MAVRRQGADSGDGAHSSSSRAAPAAMDGYTRSASGGTSGVGDGTADPRPDTTPVPRPATPRPTLAQVAAVAGVSVSTASLAFSGNGPVSESARERVHAAAQQLNYAGPDPRGRSLRQGRSGIIGVVLEEQVADAFSDPIRIALLDGIARAVTPGGRGLLLLTDVGESATAMESAPLDGAVLLACSGSMHDVLATIVRRGVPTVALGGVPLPGVPTVTIDDAEATEVAARRLHELGHRRVATVTLPLDRSGYRGPLTAERERASTVQVALDRLRGMRAVFPDATGAEATGSLVAEGITAGHLLLDESNTRPTAIMAQSDLLAAGVIRAAEELGLTVPDDLSVVGFDGIALDRIIPHDLTTLVQPAPEEGLAAGRIVLDLLAGGAPRSAHFASRFHGGGTIASPP